MKYILCIDKSIRIKSDGIYEMELCDGYLTQFNILDIRRRYENESSNIRCKSNGTNVDPYISSIEEC